jgi:hypothetical protein
MEIENTLKIEIYLKVIIIKKNLKCPNLLALMKEKSKK